MGISTHILDMSKGGPAADVTVTLARWNEGLWEQSPSTRTDIDGRCRSLVTEGASVQPGMYRIRFETGGYFHAIGARGLYPYVEVVFDVTEDRHYHIPLLLTANGYTTYRGS